MTKDEYSKVMCNTPRFYPLFKATNVPDWVKRIASPYPATEKGELFITGTSQCDAFPPIGSRLRVNCNMSMPPSALKFIGYINREGINKLIEFARNSTRAGNYSNQAMLDLALTLIIS